MPAFYTQSSRTAQPLGGVAAAGFYAEKRLKLRNGPVDYRTTMSRLGTDAGHERL
ncbi:hypothetical protein [Xaviernesmea oryzae]|uniref:hypothetical protein n=1 Tax=Xaviernesmea oryzae TaxID=464029 RepID=UPI001F30F51A|nr:hypothetical protein [Xaviernesmea oryzae]